MMTALSFHVGEVQRNPYHLLVPAWMQDNVRRGGELVGGQGGAAPDFAFATLYRLRRWVDGGTSAGLSRAAAHLAAGTDAGEILKWLVVGSWELTRLTPPSSSESPRTAPARSRPLAMCLAICRAWKRPFSMNQRLV